jgi:hypothetical protein
MSFPANCSIAPLAMGNAIFFAQTPDLHKPSSARSETVFLNFPVLAVYNVRWP